MQKERSTQYLINYRKTLSDLKDYQKDLGEECTTDEEGMNKVLFNLRSMLGFIPPTKKQ